MERIKNPSPERQRTLALFWGGAWGLWLFLPPDIWISYLALRFGWLKGLRAALWTVIGAMIGAILLYLWGKEDPATAMMVLDWAPGISQDTMDYAGEEMRTDGVSALLGGLTDGISIAPFAVQAFEFGVSPPLFMLMGVLSLVLRFCLVAFIFAGLAKLLQRLPWARAGIGLWMVGWLVVIASLITKSGV